MNNRNLAYDKAIDYEAQRPALAAFYRAGCWFQSAECVERDYPLTLDDKRHIRCLVAAAEKIAA
jgi:hypothetical protein